MHYFLDYLLSFAFLFFSQFSSSICSLYSSSSQNSAKSTTLSSDGSLLPNSQDESLRLLAQTCKTKGPKTEPS